MHGRISRSRALLLLQVVLIEQRLDHSDRLIDGVRRCIREAAEGGLYSVVAQLHLLGGTKEAVGLERPGGLDRTSGRF